MLRAFALACLLACLPATVAAQVTPPSRGGTGIGTAPSYGQLLVGNSSGGYTLTSTSSLGITGGGGLSFAYLFPSDATSTTLTFSGGLLSVGSTTVSGNATTTGMHGVGSLFINSERFTDLTGTGLSNTGGALTLDTTGDWTGTFDGLQGSSYLANSFSTTSANHWASLGLAFSTTSANAWSALGLGFSTTSANHWSSLGFGFSTTSADYWETQQDPRGITSYDAWTHPLAGVSATTSIMRLAGLNASSTVLFDNATSTLLTATTAWLTNLFIGADTIAEYIADTAGAMVSGNTESGITVAYQDADNTLDFTVAAGVANLTSTDFGDWTCNGSACTVDANAVALTTDTTGNYVATLADDGQSTVTVTNGSTEGGAATLRVIDVVCTGCLGATEIAGLGTADISGLDISDDTNLVATYPVVLTGDALSLAFGTTTHNLWSSNYFTLASSTHATSTNFDITNLLTFDGVTGDEWTDFCTAITGSADLCDGSDDGGSGSSFAYPFPSNATTTLLHLSGGASTTRLSVFEEFKAGGTATTTISSTGQLTTPSIRATADASGSIGASGTGFSDLFLSSGGAINWPSSVFINLSASDQLSVDPGTDWRLPAGSDLFMDSTNGTILLNTDGVVLSTDDGVLKILGASNGNDESLLFDFDNAAANTVAITSDSGVTNLDWTGITRNSFTNASSTLFSTGYASSTLWYGGGLLATCASGSFLTWTGGVFGCDTDDNTTYTAGDHLTLTGNDFDVDDDFLLNTGDTGTGTFDFSGATVKEHTYASFSYSTSTAWSGTTTIPLGPAYTAESWSGVKCFTDTGTLGVSFYDGTNRMNYIPTASTTVNTNALSTNNTFTASEKRYVDIGTPASSPTKISCTVNKIVNN